MRVFKCFPGDTPEPHSGRGRSPPAPNTQAPRRWGQILVPLNVSAVVALVRLGTIYMTVLVTLNRYVAVCRPYSATDTIAVRKARLHVAQVAAFSVLFNVTRFLEWEIVDSEWHETWLHENLLYKVHI